MQGYEIRSKILRLNKHEGFIDLKAEGIVISFDIEVTDQSNSPQLMFGVGESPTHIINQGDAARKFASHEVCGKPAVYRQKVNWKFKDEVSGTDKYDGLLLLTLLVPMEIKID